MVRTLFFVGLGYLSGSLLFARYFGFLFRKRDIASDSPDQNPGVFNAFRYGGFSCGVLTLLGDLAKGFFPVFLCLRSGRISVYGMGFALILAAPVLGHILPCFHRFRGGKGIAVTFGCLLGLCPFLKPLAIFAGAFLFFSLVLKISPNYYRTLFTYLVSAVLMLVLVPNAPVAAGFLLITGMVVMKLRHSTEVKEKCRVEAVWRR